MDVKKPAPPKHTDQYTLTHNHNHKLKINSKKKQIINHVLHLCTTFLQRRQRRLDRIEQGVKRPVHGGLFGGRVAPRTPQND